MIREGLVGGTASEHNPGYESCYGHGQEKEEGVASGELCHESVQRATPTSALRREHCSSRTHLQKLTREPAEQGIFRPLSLASFNAVDDRHHQVEHPYAGQEQPEQGNEHKESHRRI